ncbi:MAG: PilZ domain-containing protein [Bermanella sp.]
MKISREKPSQRRHHRVNTPIDVTINEQLYNVSDWSLGGFKIEGWEDESLEPGDEFECHFSLPFQGFFVAFHVNLIAIRADSGILAAKFTSLDERQTELLEHFIEELVRGNMTSVGDTILRIDSPVTPVSTEPDPNPKGEVPIKRWPTKLLAMTAIYVSVGLILFSYIFFTLWSNFLSLEVETGVVTAPIEAVVSSTDGKIRKVSASINQMISQGSALISIDNPAIEESLELAKIKVSRNKLLLERLRQEREVAIEQMVDYHGYSKLKFEKLELHVETLRKQERMAHLQDNRIQELFYYGHASKRDVDIAAAEHASLKREVLSAVNDLNGQSRAMESLKNGRYYTGDKFEFDMNNLNVKIEQVKQNITMDTQELLALYEHKEDLNLYAPTNGRLVELLKHPGSATKRGETIAVFERDEQRKLEVFLTQEEVLSIRINQMARVYFTSLDMAVDAIVTDIDRAYNSVDSLDTSFTWHDNTKRNSKVTLDFVGLDDNPYRENIKAGIPAVVNFPNVSVGTLGDFIRSFKIQTRPPQPSSRGNYAPTI